MQMLFVFVLSFGVLGDGLCDYEYLQNSSCDLSWATTKSRNAVNPIMNILPYMARKNHPPKVDLFLGLPQYVVE